MSNPSSTPPSQSSTTENPTIVMVQGSFQTPLVYSNLLHLLNQAGYPTIHPTLPSCTDVEHPDFPKRTLIDDALAVRMEVTRLVEYEGKKVVVLMHSYGGLVGSEAIPEELSYAYRHKKDGLSGGVIHLFYITAFILSEGQSVLGAFGESPNNTVKPDGRFIIRNAAQLLYSDLPSAEAALWGSRLIDQSYNVQRTILTRSAYRYIPSTYLIGENDQAVPSSYQEMFAKSANAKVERCSVGHSPMLSQPDVLVSKIMSAVTEALAGLEK